MASSKKIGRKENPIKIDCCRWLLTAAHCLEALGVARPERPSVNSIQFFFYFLKFLNKFTI